MVFQKSMRVRTSSPPKTIYWQSLDDGRGQPNVLHLLAGTARELYFFEEHLIRVAGSEEGKEYPKILSLTSFLSLFFDLLTSNTNILIILLLLHLRRWTVCQSEGGAVLLRGRLDTGLNGRVECPQPFDGMNIKLFKFTFSSSQSSHGF